ncbi:MAG: S9 family peptidase [Pseudomonadota bacterium]|nr:S9 family peptidase [Pseudomonadota bacterium]
MRALTASILICVATMSPAQESPPAPATELTIERIFDAPALSGPSPIGLKVSPDGTRVTFLRGKQSDQYQLDLWEYRIADKETRLLIDSKVLLPGDEDLSDDEKARRERARTASLKGILEYEFSPDGKKVLFPLNGELYLYDLERSGGATNKGAGADTVRKLTNRDLGFATDAKVSPQGRYVGFIRSQNLWAVELATDRVLQLTRDGGELISNGQAEFMAQEEMDRFTGYWWAPDDSAIAFARVDETPVPIQRRFEINAESTEVVEQRYPAAGQANVTVRLGVIDMAKALPAELIGHDDRTLVVPAVAPVQWVDLGSNTDIYLARVDWNTDATGLSFQVQSRNQRTLDLRLWNRADQSISTLLSESSDTWVNLHNDLRFLKDGSGFIWQSERDGSKRLYLYQLDGTLKHALTPESWVVDQLLAVDLNNDRIFFASGGLDPLQRHVYSTSLSTPSKETRQLTVVTGMHAASFAESADVFIDTHSNPATPPSVRLFDAEGQELSILEANAMQPGHPYWPYFQQHAIPEFGSITGAEGQSLYYQLTKPSDFDAEKKYPVLIFVYGGPHVQNVQKSWDDPLVQVMARRGYLVFTLDNRGSDRRGKAFEEPLFRRMGGPEVIDQLEGVKWLKAQSFVDADRVGVFGWSYGGYMSLLMLAKASDQIAAGVAGAPVTDWRLYDTHYTERYMDHPETNAAGYTQSAVFAHLDGLKSPLLLVHGMADDNVLFTHSTKLMSALQEKGTPFELMTYPGGKHGISLPWMKKHAYNTIADFFDRKLKR